MPGKRVPNHRSPKSTQKTSLLANGVEKIDQDFYHDRVTLNVIRHPVVGSDGGIYEASSFRDLLRHGGKGLVDTDAKLTFAVSVPILKNTIDNLFGGDHVDRNPDYNLNEVMTEIHKLLSETDSTHGEEVYAMMKKMERACTLGATGSFAILLFSCMPYTHLGLLMAYEALMGDSQSYMLNFLGKTFVWGTVFWGTSKLSLFMGDKLGFFSAPRNNHQTTPRNSQQDEYDYLPYSPNM